MTELEKLMSRARYYVDEEFDGERIIDLFNECLEDLSDVVYYPKTKTYDMAANTGKITIPKDVINIVSVKVTINGEDEEAKGIPIRGQINPDRYGYRYTYTQFGSDLELTTKPIQSYKIKLDYYGEIPAIPTTFEDPGLTTIVDIPNRFKKALPLYAAFRYYENWQEDTTMQENFRQQYLEVKMSIQMFYQGLKNKVTNSRVVVEQEWY